VIFGTDSALHRSLIFTPMSDDPDRSAGLQPAGARTSGPRWGGIRVTGRGYLRHWEVEAGTYFVSFRLHDSIPDAAVQRLKIRLQQMGVRDDRELCRKLQFQVDVYLHRGSGACHLRDSRVGKMVNDTIQEFDGECYRLMAWAVMPNHVHVVFRLLPGHTLAATMKALKGSTARKANVLLGRTGPFWQREYYDRTPRNAEELRRAVAYTLDNPRQAGLGQWPWVGCRGPKVHGPAG
jgi:REP element-mobilizing transposase RayT